MVARKTHGVKAAVDTTKRYKPPPDFGNRVVNFEPNDTICVLCGKLCGSFSWVWRDNTRLCREDAEHYFGTEAVKNKK